MIKTLIKHKIYEYAITVFFDQVYDNFINPSMSHVPRVRFLLKHINHIHQARTRRLNNSWTLEARQNISVVSGEDIEAMLLDSLRRELEIEMGVDFRALGGGYKGTGHSDTGIIYTPYITSFLS